MSSFWKKQLLDALRCPVCQTQHQALQVRLLEGEEEPGLSHMTCPTCHSSFLSYWKTQSEGVVSVGIMTDLQSEDVPHLLEGAICTDEVLSLHDWLKHPSWKPFIHSPLKKSSPQNVRVPIDKKRKISHNSDRI